MKHPSASLLPLILLGLLAALTFWLERATQIDNGRHDGKGRHDADFIIDKFTVRRFSLGGALQYVQTAQKMLHYADDDSTDVVLPELSYFGEKQNEKQKTTITARQAWLGPSGKEIRLFNDVRMVRESKADSPELVITTAEMFVYPDDEFARGDKPVTITEGRTVINGTGFEANNRVHLFKLMGRVHGIIYKKN